jgi:hypothetical protein
MTGIEGILRLLWVVIGIIIMRVFIIEGIRGIMLLCKRLSGRLFTAFLPVMNESTLMGHLIIDTGMFIIGNLDADMRWFGLKGHTSKGIIISVVANNETDRRMNITAGKFLNVTDVFELR